ncbi:hypothetical protein SNEBB_007626 [Seison nebaliae]|nr:hypothetical protein SNEBB_007626 [Seison nebaliae]
MPPTKINESRILSLSARALLEPTKKGVLRIKRPTEASTSSVKWSLKHIVLFQNLIFIFEHDNLNKLLYVYFLESTYTEKFNVPFCNLPNTSGTNSITSTVNNSSNIAPGQLNDKRNLYCFSLLYSRDGQSQLDFAAESDSVRSEWTEALLLCGYNHAISQKHQWVHKYEHCQKLYNSAQCAIWEYMHQVEELGHEVKELRQELKKYSKQHQLLKQKTIADSEIDEIRKIKKVQSLCRGWLYRKRWKNIVEEYIKSPHATNMRQRNRIVFNMLSNEEKYVGTLEVVILYILRPLRIAASSRNPPLSHEEINSIFLNIEHLLFLHQIFFKGLLVRMENWPKLILGDLFDLLLPMLHIYQDYVRNHHYSLQILTECKQTYPMFRQTLDRFFNKMKLSGIQSNCMRNSLEEYLALPMEIIPNYIIILGELLARTPHQHIERKSLESAKAKLEELSNQMSNEISETENIRTNLGIERMIVGGCEALLDTSQTLIRNGTLHQMSSLMKSQRSNKFQQAFNRMTNSSANILGERNIDITCKKDVTRQCYLFTNHMIITTRNSQGLLVLAKEGAVIPLKYATLIEDVSSCLYFNDCNDMLHNGKNNSLQRLSVHLINVLKQNAIETNQADPIKALSKNVSREFRIVFENEEYGKRSNESSTDSDSFTNEAVISTKKRSTITMIFMAATEEDKQAWCADIAQCIENIHFSDLLSGAITETALLSTSSTKARKNRCVYNTAIWNDSKLFKDDNNIKYAKALNSCKVPQIRYGKIERILDRLIDLRFLSIDYLNIFLLTYRVYIYVHAIVDILFNMYEYPKKSHGKIIVDVLHSYGYKEHRDDKLKDVEDFPQHLVKVRKSFLENILKRPTKYSEYITLENIIRPLTYQSLEEECFNELNENKETILTDDKLEEDDEKNEEEDDSMKLHEDDERNALLAPVASFDSSSIVTNDPSNDEREESPINIEFNLDESIDGPRCNRCDKPLEEVIQEDFQKRLTETLISPRVSILRAKQSDRNSTCKISPAVVVTAGRIGRRRSSSQIASAAFALATSGSQKSPSLSSLHNNMPTRQPLKTNMLPTVSENFDFEEEEEEEENTGQRSSAIENNLNLPKPKVKSGMNYMRYSAADSSSTGMDSPMFRSTKRNYGSSISTQLQYRSDNSSKNEIQQNHQMKPSFKIETPNIMSETKTHPTAKTMRVLNIFRHWITKHAVDFEQSIELKDRVFSFLENLLYSPSVTEVEYRTSVLLLEQLVGIRPKRPDEQSKNSSGDLTFVQSLKLLNARTKYDISPIEIFTLDKKCENYPSFSPIEIAEQMTLMDHLLFSLIRSEELICKRWEKDDKEKKPSHVLLVSSRFNHMSQLVVNEVVQSKNIRERICIIEKWTQVADTCRMLQNYNGILQIISAFNNSAVFRLQRTWEKVPKLCRQTIQKLQNIVSSDGMFKNMRELLQKHDPPTVPYLGTYLHDLTFLEDGTPDTIDDNLINFSKMRLISLIIRDVKNFQEVPYKLTHNQTVANYLLDDTKFIRTDDLYEMSLKLEPRPPN